MLMMIADEKQRSSSARPMLRVAFRVLAVGLFPLALTVTAAPRLVFAETLAAWVEVVGPSRDASIRVIVSADSDCPTLTADGQPLKMRVRAEPGQMFTEGDLPPPAHFPVRVCEVNAPEGKAKVLLEGNEMPLPRADIQRIIVFGDTGCRIKKKKKPQDCDDSDKWPYAKVSTHAAQAHPDLVIHLGDYLYRESCRLTACENARTGYDWEVWNTDFFTPSAPLFAAAPWVMIRGNDENCSRAADGWFRFLDHAPPDRACPEVSPSFVVDLGSLGFVVMDSAAVSGSDNADSADDDDDDDEAGSGQSDNLIEKIRREYAAIAQSIPAPAWLLTHSPFNAIRRDKTTGENKVDNTILQEAVGEVLSPDIAMIVSGHIHIFEALTFGQTNPQRRPQLVVGTGGDKLAKKPEKPIVVDGVTVDDALILKSFGYMVLDRDGANWKGELFDEGGSPIAHCRLGGHDLACEKEQ